jgi:hypothetical protein
MAAKKDRAKVAMKIPGVDRQLKDEFQNWCKANSVPMAKGLRALMTFATTSAADPSIAYLRDGRPEVVLRSS